MHQRTLDLGFPTQSEPELGEMENGGQWELPEARSEALRRRLVAEEQAVERSQGRSASIDRPEAHDPIEDDWDPFCPLDYELMTGLTKKPTVPDAEAEANQRRAAEASELAWKKYKAEEEKSEEYEWSQRYAIEASQFRDEWNTIWCRYYGPYEAITEIPNMRFTHEPAPRGANPCNSLQIFSVKVTELGGGLQWPLDVFGMVAVRDTIDKRRNIVFDRKRDNCQTLTEKKDPVTIEAELVVKGTVESEDKILSYLAVEPMIYGTLYSELLIRDYPSKLSTFEFTLGHMFIAVEATIFLQVVDGSWPDGFSGRFVACTASIDQEVVLLFHSGDKIFPCTDDGNVKLSRCVASVEVNGKLQVSVKAWKVDNSGKSKTELFMSEKADEDYLQEVGVCAPTLADSSIEKKWFSHQKKSGRSDDTLDVGFCKIKVDVAWSVIWLDLA